MNPRHGALTKRARGIKKIGGAAQEFLDEVLSVIDACLFPKPKQ